MTLYQLGEEYLRQADDLKNVISVFSTQRSELCGVALFELNSKITTLREMERDTRILGKKLVHYYSGNDCKGCARTHRRPGSTPAGADL